MRIILAILTLLVAVSLLGCRSSSDTTPDRSSHSENPAPAADRPVAYINGQPATREELYNIMAQQLGGEALAELALDRIIKARLQSAGQTLGPEALAIEKQRLLDGLSADPDQAAVLLSQMRAQRGLDDVRFEALLRRNAGLRALIRQDIEVGDAAVQQAYQASYGPRYRVRLLLTTSVDDAGQARARAVAGTDFTQLVIHFSTDASKAQGGLLSPISPVDTSYPKAIRDALPRLAMDSAETRLSPVIAIESGFALLWLEEVIPAKDVPMATVEVQLRQSVRLQLERVRMQQLARTMLEQANIVVLDPLLDKGWRQQREAILSGGE